jgi:uncharacterized protein
VQDELVKPLAGRARKDLRATRRALPVTKIVLGALAVSAIGIGLYIALFDDPLGGEPHIISTIVARAVPVEAPATEPEPRRNVGLAPGKQQAFAEPTQRNPITPGEWETQSGVSVVRGGGENPSGAIVIRLSDPVSTKLAPAPDQRLVERTRYGMLPRIGRDGARPSEVYARPVGQNIDGPGVKIAIVVSGLGISQSATTDAVAKLPGGITLAFAPYGADLERHVAKAREDGHEVMLQAPMEPFDYPDNDPGPHTLTVEAKTSENIDKLHWILGRFSGYVGIVNFMGAKITADQNALTPILKEMGERGLFFLDDGSSPRSIASDVAQKVKTTALKADIILDATSKPDAIDKELARLEAMARQKGSAIATATGLPVSIERIAKWAETAEKRGIRLVPISSLASGRAAN